MDFSKKARSADNQQERSVRIKYTIISVVLMIVGFIFENFIFFDNVMDPYIVPLVGIRPILSVITASIFMLPGLAYGKYKKVF